MPRLHKDELGDFVVPADLFSLKRLHNNKYYLYSHLFIKLNIIM